MRSIGLTPCPDQDTIKIKVQFDQANSVIQSQNKAMDDLRKVNGTPLLVLG
jgi:hypothetical protein